MPSSTMEVKVKKEKSSKKIKSEKPNQVAIIESEGVEMTETLVVEKKSKKEKREKKEKKEKKSKSNLVEETTDAAEQATEEESKKSKKSKRTREAESTKEASPEADAMSVDSNSDEPSSKKRKVAMVPEGEELEVDVTLPQPPSKKELRLLKKGKKLPKAKTTSELKAPLKEGEEEKPAKPEQEKRSEHGIWVGNLPWSVSKEDLKSFLINQGPILEERITRIHMPSPEDGKPANKVESRFTRKQHNKGFAYVDFSTAEDTNKAVALSEELLGGRRVLIKNNKSFEGRPLVLKEDKNKKPEGKPPNKRIFLGNLRFDTTEESLKEHFERCGPIEQCMVATFEDSGKCKGYAWITFEELASAERAVRGFYLEEDKGSDEDTDDEDEEEEKKDAEEEEMSDPEDYAKAVEKKEKPKKKPNMRRVYVNMIQRRPIRIEYAEDAGLRYKKRYGAGGTKNPAAEGGDANQVPRAERVEKVKEPVSGKIELSKKAQKMDYRNEYAPRLTGGIVESQGTKVTF